MRKSQKNVKDLEPVIEKFKVDPSPPIKEDSLMLCVGFVVKSVEDNKTVQENRTNFRGKNTPDISQTTEFILGFKIFFFKTYLPDFLFLYVMLCIFFYFDFL